MRMLQGLKVVAVVGLVAAAGAACGTKDATSSAPPASGVLPTATTPATAGPGTTVGTTCAQTLAISGSKASDGPMAPGRFLADDGPHPANTVDADRSLELGLASYDLPPDPQFGISIPIGVPEPPADGAILLASLSKAPGQPVIAVGDRFTSELAKDRQSTDGTIDNIGLFSGADGRINPLGDVTITLTALDDAKVCATVTTVTRTASQSLPGVAGAFTADRIQALEAG